MSGFPVARVAGFEIRLHLSWLPILIFVAVVVAWDVADAPGGPADPGAWIVGVLVAFGFLGSVLVHELAHALVGRRRGVETSAITLFFFGGTASVELDAATPADERAIALAGPIVSAALGVGLLAAALPLGSLEFVPAALARAVILIVGVLNLFLAFLNLVPAFPLDGGRVLRAIIWSRTRSERSGTRGAATAGRLTGWALTFAGLGVAVTGAGPDGVMLIVSGWLLGNASAAMERRLLVEDLLRGMTVEQAMERETPTVAPQLTVDTFGDQLSSGATSGLAVMRDDELLGVIGRGQVRRLSRPSWATTRAGEVMIAAAHLQTLRPDEALWPAVEALRRSGLDVLPVVDGAALLGLLTRPAVMATIAARAKLGANRPT
jgi:Zn-dependent protease/CBS domain-containing protein